MAQVLVEGPIRDYISYLKSNRGVIYSIRAIAKYTPTMIAKIVGFKKPYLTAVSDSISELEEAMKNNPKDARFAEFFYNSISKTIAQLEKGCKPQDLECNKLINQLRKTKEYSEKILPQVSKNFGVSPNTSLFAGAVSLSSGIVMSNILHNSIASTDYPDESNFTQTNILSNLNVFKIVMRNISILKSDDSVFRKVISLIALTLIIAGVSIVSYRLFLFISNRLNNKNI